MANPEGWVEGWPPAKLSSWQGEDPVISKVLGWVIANKKPSWTNVKAETPLVRSCWSLWS